jgi:hypothetical protein
MTTKQVPQATDAVSKLLASKLLAASKEGVDLTVASEDSVTSAEQEFQQYRCAKASTRLITTSGFRITFTNFQYLTQNAEAIDYLDSQIACNGIQGITKGDVLTTSDLNPMEALRKTMEASIRKEIAAKAVADALGESKDMGYTDPLAKLNAATSKNVAG